MKLFKIFLISSMALLVFSTAVIANDFSWTRDFNIQAKADPIGFRTRFATRFNLSDLQVIALLSIFDSPADAYIMLRLGEIQGMLNRLSKEQGIAAIKKYRNNKGKGWEVLAKSLGIKPGSNEFHALKRGHDLDGDDNSGQVLYSAVYDNGNANYEDNDNGNTLKARLKN